MLLAAVVLGPLVAPVLADSTANVATLGGPGRFYSATIWTGQDAYVFAGSNQTFTHEEVLKYTPSSGQDAQHFADLDEPIHSISAASNGTHVFLFGGVLGSAGVGNGEDTAQIRQFNLTGDKGTSVVANLPSARRFSMAFWNGTHAFIVGGWDPGATEPFPHDIVRFDPVTREVVPVVNQTTHGAVAQHILSGAGLIWDGTSAFLFGGGGCPNPGPGDPWFNWCTDIVRFTPATNNVTVMQATLPEPRRGVTAAWDGTAAYVFGNESGMDNILRYRPDQDAPGRIGEMSAKLPEVRGWANSFWNGTNAFVLTGKALQVTFPDAIVNYDLKPGPPQNLDAKSLPGLPVEIGLGWEPPLANTYTQPIQGYRLYRALLDQPPALYQELGNVLAFTDTNVTLGVYYCYWVSAVNVRGEGELSVRDCAVAQ